MTLDDWLNWKQISTADFAVRLNVTRPTCWRYRARQLRPAWSTMLAIYRETDGHVTPNDFLVVSNEEAESQRGVA